MGDLLGFVAAVLAISVAVWSERRRRVDAATAHDLQLRLEQRTRQQTRSEEAAAKLAATFGSILATEGLDDMILSEIAIASMAVGDEIAGSRIRDAFRLLQTADHASVRLQCERRDIIQLAARHGLNAAAHVATGQALGGDPATVKAIVDLLETPSASSSAVGIDDAERIVRAASWVGPDMLTNIRDVLTHAVVNGKVRAKPDYGGRYGAIELLQAVGALDAHSGWHSWMNYALTPLGMELHARLALSRSGEAQNSTGAA